MEVVTDTDILIHRPALQLFAMKLCQSKEVAEDLVQDTIIQALEKRYTLDDLNSLKSWIYTILYNRFRNHLRNNRRLRDAASIEDVYPFLFYEVDFDASFNSGILSEYLVKLPKLQRVAVYLIAFGHTHEDVAALLKCPYDTAKANYRHGIVKLRKMIEADYGISSEQCLSWTETERLSELKRRWDQGCDRPGDEGI